MKQICVKLLSTLLVVAMLCSMLPGFAFAADIAETSEEHSEKTETAAEPVPLFAEEKEMVCDANGITDYATRADSTSETYTYVLVRSAKNLTAGEYLIVAAATGPYAGNYGYYALTTKEDDQYMMIQGVGQSFTTLPTTLNVAASIRDQFAWTLRGDLSSLTMKTPAGTYLTAAAGSSALSLSSKGTNWMATYNADKKAFTFEAYDRYLTLRTDVTVVGTNGMCAFATSVPNTADAYLHVYKRVNTTELKSVLLYHSLNLASDITLNYALPKAQFEGFEQIRMEINRPIYEGNSPVDWETTLMEPVESGDYYYFTLEGITAIQMNDILQAVIYAHKDGINYITETDYYSVGTYAYNQMAKAGTTPALRTVCAELLRYGSTSQLYKNYRTDALVDSAMTEEQKAYLHPLENVAFGSCKNILNDLPGASVTWAGVGLDLQSKVSVRMILNLSQYTGDIDELSVRVNYIDVEGKTATYTVDSCEVYSEENHFYAFNFSGLRAAELRTVLSAAAYIGDTQVSATLQYSVDTYGNGKKGALLTTCQALIAYADAARNYFGE